MNKFNDKWAVVLCGGTGARMGSLTNNIPKPLLLVDNKPIIWYVISSLVNTGFNNIVFPLGYKGQQIKDYVIKTFNKKTINFYFEETGDHSSIAKRIGLVKDIIPDDEDFFLLNSDTIFSFDIESMFNLHKKNNSLVTLSSVEVTSPWGIMTIENGELTSFDRERAVYALYNKLNSKGMVHSGLAWINKLSLDFIDLFSDIDFETELFQKTISLNRASYYPIKGIWIPIDTPKDLDKINLNFKSEQLLK
jgi:glucose-1-phosphate cytidylyltransferase